MGHLVADWRQRGLLFRAALLASAVFIAFAAIGSVAGCIGGSSAVMAAGLAAASCWAGATAALAMAKVLRHPCNALERLLIGMTARMGTPLAVGLACHVIGSPLVGAGLLYYLLIFYPLTLVVETALSLPANQPLAYHTGPTPDHDVAA